MGVTLQEVAISAMVNWRLSYMRCALPIRAGVIFGLRPPVRPRARAAARPARVRSLMSAASYSLLNAGFGGSSAGAGGGSAGVSRVSWLSRVFRSARGSSV